MIDLIDLIKYLRPNEPFVLNGNDLSGLIFDNFVQEILPEELENAKILLEQEKLSKESDKATKKTALLARLGITAEEATLLLS